jgi:hypothetical protein
VRRWLKLADWSGNARSFTVPLSDIETENTSELAVLVQSGEVNKPGRMLGAALAAVH